MEDRLEVFESIQGVRNQKDQAQGCLSGGFKSLQ